MRAAPDSSKCVNAEVAAGEGLGAGLEGEGMGRVYNKMARGVLFWIGGGRKEGRSSASREHSQAALGNDRKMARGVLFWIVGGLGEGRSSASRDAFPSSAWERQGSGAWERQGRQEAGLGNDRGATMLQTENCAPPVFRV